MSAMAYEQQGSTLAPVMAAADSAGDVQRRRERLGMSVRALAKEARVDRSRVDLVEAGKEVTPRVMSRILSALDRIEEEVSGPYDEDEAEGNVVTFRLKGNFGVDVTVQGPVNDLPELEASVTRLLRTIQDTPQSPGQV